MTFDRRLVTVLLALVAVLMLAASAGAETAAPIGVPLLMPAPLIVASAVLRGPEGCVRDSVVTSRIATVNAITVTFIRDGRFLGTRAVRSVRGDVAVLRTRLAAGDRRLHTVVARVVFIDGSRPLTRVLLHRFGRCPSGAAA